MIIPWLLLLAAPAFGGPTVTLPLDGWYRPGRFFPVMVTSDTPVTAEVDIADGVGAKAMGKQFVLPVMELSADATAVQVIIDGRPTELPIRALGDQQDLTVDTRINRAQPDLRPLPDERHLYAKLPLYPSCLDLAFESADAFVVGDIASEAAKAAAWRSGVPLVSDIGQLELGRSSIFRGPASSRDDSAVYDAASDMPPGRSAMQIRTALLLATLFCVIVLGAALMLRRRAWMAITGISFVATVAAGFAIDRPAIAISDRLVLLPSARLAQEDRWTYRTALNDADDVFTVGLAASVGHFAEDLQSSHDSSAGAGEITRPIFGGQAGTVHLWIEPTADGWTFHEHLPRGTTMTFVTRSLDARSPGTLPVTPAEPSPWTRVVQRLYAGPGDVVGETRDENNRLLTIVQPAVSNPSDSTSVTTSAKPAPH